ncbi:permease prefix domain 1-containing protein [Actinoplanes sp. NPDC049596]|uniref:permease prefix domain 1-containing protein n=1 Tax=unclassified Actinoplanes TaxID=2626549 RepID=UPI003441CCBB
MTSLVDRYVYTALRRIPEQQRSDIDRELRASIDDAVDARVESGEPLDTAVENALLELGDPDKLADSYADRPNFLIGPELYGVWRRFMLMLFTTVLPIVVVATSIGGFFADDVNIGAIIGNAIGTALTVGVHLAFWTTATFAVIERTGLGRDELRGGPWTPKDLPKYEPRAVSLGQVVTYVVWPVILIAAIILQRFTFTDVPVLDPGGWSFWWPLVIALIALKALWAVWLYRTGWTRPVLIVNALIAVAVGAVTTYLLASDNFFNPAFDWITDNNTDLLDWITPAVIVATIAGTLWDILETTIRGERARRGLPTKVPGSGNTYKFG